MFRSVILAASRSSRLERLVVTAPISRDIVARFVAGPETSDALRVTGELVDQGFAVSLDHLGEDTNSQEQVDANRRAYLELLRRLGETGAAGAAGRVEVSVKLSSLGQKADERVALEHARAICAAASHAGTTVTLDMEDHTTTDSTLDTLLTLRKDFPETGVALQAYLRRTEADCRELALPGSRVRLCKGAYAEPESVAYQSKLDVDRSYVRCMNILLAGGGYPMLATHDPRLVEIAEDRSRWYDRSPGDFEFQLLYGVRPDEQRRLVDAGYQVRVYVPYGTQSYRYLIRRVAERPANVAFLARAFLSRR